LPNSRQGFPFSSTAIQTSSTEAVREAGGVAARSGLHNHPTTGAHLQTVGDLGSVPSRHAGI